MTEENKLEAGEKMSQLEKIIEGWEGEQTEDIAYQIPLNGKPIADVGKCRVVIDFESLTDAESMVAEIFTRRQHAAMFMMDSIASDSVPAERTFIVRRDKDMPKELRLHKITVNVEPVGG